MNPDYADWLALRSLGAQGFLLKRMARFGAPLGVALATLNCVAGGTFGDFSPRRVVVEAIYYFVGSVVLTGVGSVVEMRYLTAEHDSGA